MDMNGYIQINSQEVLTSRRFGTFGTGEFVNHVTFKVLHSADKNGDFIPDWFKDQRVIRLIDHCVDNNIVHNKNIYYHISSNLEPGKLKLNGIVFKFLSLVDLTKLSEILPIQEILEFVKFKPSEPYHTVERPDKVCYDLYCFISWEIKMA
jgi:hypothetical protein